MDAAAVVECTGAFWRMGICVTEAYSVFRPTCEAIPTLILIEEGQSQCMGYVPQMQFKTIEDVSS